MDWGRQETGNRRTYSGFGGERITDKFYLRINNGKVLSHISYLISLYFLLYSVFSVQTSALSAVERVTPIVDWGETGNRRTDSGFDGERITDKFYLRINNGKAFSHISYLISLYFLLYSAFSVQTSALSAVNLLSSVRSDKNHTLRKFSVSYLIFLVVGSPLT